MLFTSIPFIIFFTIVFVLYYTIPSRFQYICLLAASLFFYVYAGIKYSFFLVGISLITYIGAVLIDKNRERFSNASESMNKEEKKFQKKRMLRYNSCILTAVVVVLLGILFSVKYLDFFFSMFSGIFGIFNLSPPAISIIFPIGISFYTFQALGYVIDVKRDVCRTEKNFLKHMLFTSYFPLLLQGPISTYSELAMKLFEKHVYNHASAAEGLKRIVWGMFKKLVIAENINTIIYEIIAVPNSKGIVIAISFICYAIQLYADFSGYMDIAIGCSSMLGIDISENFETPYFSKSIAEFWRRWHITLGTWFRNYVFYPLQLSRLCSEIRKKTKKSSSHFLAELPNLISLLVVWILIGLWHGSSWCYVFYGLFHGGIIIISVIEKPFIDLFNENVQFAKSRAYNCFRIIRTFSLVTFGYMIFAPGNINITIILIKNMLKGIYFSELVSLISEHRSEFIILIVPMLIFIAVEILHEKNIKVRALINSQKTFIRWSVYVLAVFAIFLFGAYTSANSAQFIYFKF